MEKRSMEELSEHTSCQMDELGFSKNRISERIHTANKYSRAKDVSTKKILNRNDVEKIIVGSQREGIGYDHLNDLDVLQIDHGVICQKRFQKFPEGGRVVFQMEQKNVPPGYCFLKLIHKDDQSASFARVKYAIQTRKKQKYLSSEVFMRKNDDVFTLCNGFISQHTHYKSRQGPSIPKYVEMDFWTKFVLSRYNLGCTDIDFVRAFPCKANYMLQEWKNRERPSGWPSTDTIAHVMNLPAHVVPVGQKGSKNIDLQWRICFNMGEIHLVQTFNNVQTKVFVLMKLIAKHVLHPLSECITSYVVKTVMLWLAEEIPQADFGDRQLIQRLQDALKYLKRSIQNACLPCYMLPKRNLFAGKLRKEDQCLVLEKLNYMLENGTELVSNYIYKSGAFKHEAIDKVYTSLYYASNLDKFLICRFALFSSEDLAEYFVTMFLYKSQWSILLYNILFHAVPYLYTYGFSELLSIDLESQLAEEEAKELEMKSVERSQPTANPKPDLQTYKAETSDDNKWFSHLIPVFLMFLLMDSGGFLVNIFPRLAMLLSIFGNKTTITISYMYILMVIHMALWLITEYKKTSSRQTFLQIYQKNITVNTYIPKTLYNFDAIICTVAYWLQLAIVFNLVSINPKMFCSYPYYSLLFVLSKLLQYYIPNFRFWDTKDTFRNIHLHNNDDLTKAFVPG